MKVLHLFSNSKWTGPAEPVVNLCYALRQRGIDVTLACARGLVRGPGSPVAERAREKGIKTVTDFRLGKHMNVRRTLSDAWRLRKYIDAEKFDLIHAHMKTAHLVGGLAARRTKGFPPILRTSYDGDGLRPGFRNRVLLRKYTDGFITCSRKARKADIANFQLPEERVWTVYGAVDTDKFNPDRRLPELRTRFRLSTDHFVVGVVARIQPRRKFDVLLEAVARASRQMDTLRVLIVGRGTHMTKVVIEPSKRLHLESCVIFPGYLTGDEYVAAVKSLDAKVYLFPGTDGTCRALLQAMALAKPCIVANRGTLPEIVIDGVDGFVVEDDPVSLSNAILKLGRDPKLRLTLGLNARKKTVRDFSLQKQASVIEDIYHQLTESHLSKQS